MAVNRAEVVEDAFKRHVARLADLPRRPLPLDTTLDKPTAWAAYDAQVTSRILDLVAREIKVTGDSFYTIGSAGHEGNAVLGLVTTPRDLAFLHYRSGAFFCARAASTPGPEGAFDVLLGLVASSDEPIAGGRHKVFGSVPLGVPPQTSTIASQLPKAVGYAMAIDRLAHLEGRTDDRIAIVSFGDASVNHATAQTAFNAAGWATWQNVPVPCLFVCEDNGIGISVRTPKDWTQATLFSRPGLAGFDADGLDLVDAYDRAREAVDWVRTHRRPAILRLRTVRLLGHAGSDVEQTYRDLAEIEAAEALDPLKSSAEILFGAGWATPKELLDHWARERARIGALAKEAIRRPKITTRAEVVAPLFRHDAAVVAASIPVGKPDARSRAFGGQFPEQDARPRHMAVQINRALADILAADDRSMLFGEDVARKGGVYHVTADLMSRFGVGRVFNTLLDETTILGLAIGASMAGWLPIAEIQYLAYLINAVDQLRGEAGSLQYFSNGGFHNGMVVRIAGLAYQKGFGGHFHNDNGISALREVPGILIATPARGDDAAKLLRTLASCARTQGRVTAFLEPIALYMTKDLHRDGDGGMLSAYPPPSESIPVGEVGASGSPSAGALVLASYANGTLMCWRVAERLRADGHAVRVIDLRWLNPLPHEGLRLESDGATAVLVVDECRASSGVADSLIAQLVLDRPSLRVGRVVAPDTYIPLGAAANLVLVQEDEIETAARGLLGAQ